MFEQWWQFEFQALRTHVPERVSYMRTAMYEATPSLLIGKQGSEGGVSGKQSSRVQHLADEVSLDFLILSCRLKNDSIFYLRAQQRMVVGRRIAGFCVSRWNGRCDVSAKKKQQQKQQQQHKYELTEQSAG